MTAFPGFTLPDELRLMRDQVRRFIREEIIPLEQRLDPDAPGIPDEDFERLSAKTKAAGININLWAGLVILAGGAIFLTWARLRPLRAADLQTTDQNRPNIE